MIKLFTIIYLIKKIYDYNYFILFFLINIMITQIYMHYLSVIFKIFGKNNYILIIIIKKD